VIGFGAGKGDELIIAETEGGKKIPLGPGHDEVVSRGGKGRPIAKRTKIVKVARVGDGEAGEDEDGDGDGKKGKGGGGGGGGGGKGKGKLLN
jgi:hypothetical protein